MSSSDMLLKAIRILWINCTRVSGGWWKDRLLSIKYYTCSVRFKSDKRGDHGITLKPASQMKFIVRLGRKYYLAENEA